MNLSQFMKNKREDQHRTVMDVALEADLSIAYVSDIENGKKRPLKRSTLMKIALSLNVPYLDVKKAVIQSVNEDLGE